MYVYIPSKYLPPLVDPSSSYDIVFMYLEVKLSFAQVMHACMHRPEEGKAVFFLFLQLVYTCCVHDVYRILEQGTPLSKRRLRI